jgi:hypothetical protein
MTQDVGKSRKTIRRWQMFTPSKDRGKNAKRLPQHGPLGGQGGMVQARKDTVVDCQVLLQKARGGFADGPARQRSGLQTVQRRIGIHARTLKPSAHPHPFIMRVEIAGVVDPPISLRHQRLADRLPSGVKKRSDKMVPTMQENDGCHARKSAGVLIAPLGPHRDGFQLVIQSMPGENAARTDFVGNVDEETVAGLPRRGRNGRTGLLILPAADHMRNGELAAQRCNLRRLTSRFSPQGMIDGHGVKGNALESRILSEELIKAEQKAGRVTAAGNGNQKARRAVAMAQKVSKSVPRRKDKGSRTEGRGIHCQQASRFCSLATLLRTGLPAAG